MQVATTPAPLAHVTATATNQNSLRIGPFSKQSGFSSSMKFELARGHGEDVKITGDTFEHVLVGAQHVVDSFDTGLGERPRIKGEVVAAVVQAADGSYQLTAPSRGLGVGTGARTWWGNDRFEARLQVTDAHESVRAVVANGLDPIIIGDDRSGSSTTVID